MSTTRGIRPDRRAFMGNAIAIAALAGLGPNLPQTAFAQGRTPGCAPPQPRAMLRGLNLAGAEFGTRMPGEHGRDYVYPGAADFTYCRELGFDVVRLPFRWERLQPDVGGPFDPAEWRRLEGAIALASGARLHLILDVHNYARRKVRSDGYQGEHLIGSREVPSETFSEMWAEIARRTRQTPRLIFGLMNEPADIDVQAWLDASNAAIRAIRATGADNLVLASGVAYSGAHSWYGAHNTIMEGLADPCGNLAIDVHQYLDDDSSGRGPRPTSTTAGSERMAAFQQWARARRIKAFLGEFGGAGDATSLAALADLVLEVESNPDVWLGWTAWAGGPWWPEQEPMRLSRDKNGASPPQARLLASAAQDTIARGWAAGAHAGALEIDFARQRIAGASRIADCVAVARAASRPSRSGSGRLAPFPPNSPRIDDRGLCIGASPGIDLPRDSWRYEAAGKPSAERVAPPASFGPQAMVALDDGAPVGAWRLDAVSGAITPAADLLTFDVHVHADPRARSLVEFTSEAWRAVFDVGAGALRDAAPGVWASISSSGDWRQVQITWRPGATSKATSLGVRLLPPSLAPVGATRRVLLWGPALSAHSGTVIGDHTRREPDERVRAMGRLADGLARPEATVMIETQDLTPAPIACPLLARGGALWLGRNAEGALASGLGIGRATVSLPPGRWQGKVRSALSWSARTGMAGMALTGAPAVTWRIDGFSPAGGAHEIGGDGRDTLGGRIVRIHVIDAPLAGEALAALVA